MSEREVGLKNASRRSFIGMSAIAGITTTLGLPGLASAKDGVDAAALLKGVRHWVRFSVNGKTGFGEKIGEYIHVYTGNLFGEKKTTGKHYNIQNVQLLPPCEPFKVPALWNNFYKRAEKEGLAHPEFPLFFYKSTNGIIASGETIQQPVNYSGAVGFEGELGIVIGKTCKNINEADVDSYIFGYTVLNDVTARTMLKSDKSFVQWDRAKGFDTFCPIGPVITSGIEPNDLIVRSLVNGVEKQNYPVADMIFRPRQLVSRISQDITLYPGDIIACGTSLGAEAMPKDCQIDIVIDGIGTLTNRFA